MTQQDSELHLALLAWKHDDITMLELKDVMSQQAAADSKQQELFHDIMYALAKARKPDELRVHIQIFLTGHSGSLAVSYVDGKEVHTGTTLAKHLSKIKKAIDMDTTNA